MWFYLLPIGAHFVFDTVQFWLGFIYVSFPMSLLIYGWNDLVDTDTDRRNPRKGTYLFGARPSDADLRRLPIVIALVQVPFYAAFAWYIGWRALLLLFGVVAFSWLYNSRTFGFKNLPVLDVLNQSGYLLVFILSSWLNGVPQLPWYVFVFGALFAMHSHLLGATMDIEPDRAAGRRTTAGVLGRAGAKWLMVAMLLIEAALIGWFGRDRIIGLGLSAMALWFVLDATLIWKERPYTKRQMAAFLLGWNVVAIVTAPWIWWTGALTARIP